MKISQESSFVKYELTKDEMIAACHLSPETRALIQNLIADSAEKKVGLKYDPANPQQFLQVEAELQGEIGILKYLLSLESQTKPEVI